MKEKKMKNDYWDNNLGSKKKGKKDTLVVKKPFMKLTYKEIAEDVKSIRESGGFKKVKGKKSKGYY